MDVTAIIIMLALVGIVGGGVLGYFRARCPGCSRIYSLKVTGEWERREGLLSGGVFEEHRCKHCEHTEWKPKPFTPSGC